MSDERIIQPISNHELERRWAAVRDMMDRDGLDALVLQNTSDWVGGYVKWFTDLPATNGYPRTVIFHRNEPMTMVEMGPFNGRRELAGKDPVHRGVGTVLNSPSFVSIVYTLGYDAKIAVDELKRHNYRRVGCVNMGALPHALVSALQEGLTNVQLVDCTDAIDTIKAVKSPEEIDLLYRCAHLQDEVFAKVLGMIRVTRAALPLLRAAGGGSIVNVTSIKGRQPPPRVVTSGVAWAAAMNLSKGLSLELAADNIRVNVVSVGGIMTDQMEAGRRKWAPEKSLEAFLAPRVANIPLQRLGSVEEVAQTIYFLGSPLSGYVTGQCIAVDGGGLRSI